MKDFDITIKILATGQIEVKATEVTTGLTVSLSAASIGMIQKLKKSVDDFTDKIKAMDL